MFVHLHNHSEFSMLDSTAKIKNMVAKAKELGMNALAITDHGNMHGALAFYKECKKNGIKPIIGCELYLTNDLDGRKDKTRYHLILLAETTEGYHNLVRIVSESTRHVYYKPLVDKNILKKWNKGIICLSACINGEVPRAILNKGFDEAKKVAQEYIDIYGKENFFIEVQDHNLSEEKNALPQLFALAKEMGLKVVATNDMHYIDSRDNKAQDILLCIQTKSTLNDSNRLTFVSREFYFKSEEEMMKVFGDQDGCISNTQLIADRCHAEIETGQDLAPHFPKLPEGETESSFLRRLCEESIAKKYTPEQIPEARKRMEYELGVIEKMNYSGYFLIVWDFIRYARSVGIPIGPGRGSAVGSIVCYLTDISMLDPIKYDLLFERFLNPDRISMPDIDTDIAYEGRPEIVRYMVETYGSNNSAQIATFSHEKPKNSIRDVARVLGLPASFASKLTECIPTKINGTDHITLDAALKNSEEFNTLYRTDPRARDVIDVSRTIEDLPRQDGTHAAGVVICKEPLENYIPVTSQSDGLHTQFDKDEVEEIGLLKMDLLGLRNLSIIQRTAEIVKKETGEELDVYNLPLDDKETMDMLCAGDTFGVFQLESSGITEIVKQIQPREFKDLIPIMALYRPGPLGSGMVDDFIACRKGEKEIQYIHPCLEPILKETFGVMLYQEQVMKVVQVMAGFSLGQADLVRRAMGKKKEEILQAQKKDFVEGCIKNNIDKSIAERVFDMMLQFAKYGFNKSHSAAYGFISYITAYLKAHYPKAYIASYISAYIHLPEKVRKTIHFCSKNRFKINPPDVMRSDTGFSVDEDGNIRYGLMAVDGFGEAAALEVVREREEKPFANALDFMLRVSNVAKDLFVKLVKVGAFNSIEEHPSVLMDAAEEIYDKVKEYKKLLKKEEKKGMDSLFGEEADIKTLAELLPSLPAPREISLSEQITNENSVLGYYLSAHPLDFCQDTLAKTTSIDEIVENFREMEGRVVNVCGVNENIRVINTKKGKTMAFMRLGSYENAVDCVLFPDTYHFAAINDVLTKGIVLLKEATIKIRNDQPSIIVKKIQGKNI